MKITVSTFFPLDQPKMPANIVAYSDISFITLSWEYDKECYENTTFKFIVSVTKPDDNEGSMMLETHGTFLNISSLQHSTEYIICLWAVSSENKQVRSKEVHFSQRTSDGKTTTFIHILMMTLMIHCITHELIHVHIL